MKIKIRCPGKVILFGEHACVYGYPALVTTISAYTTVEIEQTLKPEISYHVPDLDFNNSCQLASLDNVEQISDEASKKLACEQIKQILMQKQSVTENSWFLLLYLYHKIVPKKERCGIKVSAKTNLWPSSGLGSSASYCCCVALGLLSMWGKDVSLENVNNIAYDGEKIFHGTPSGVDNTACTFGGSFVFQKDTNKQKTNFCRFNLSPDDIPRIIVINSNQPHCTKSIVSEVNKMSNQLVDVFREIGDVVNDAVARLEKGQDIGNLIPQNHELLQKLPGLTFSKYL